MLCSHCIPHHLSKVNFLFHLISLHPSETTWPQTGDWDITERTVHRIVFPFSFWHTLYESFLNAKSGR